MIMRFPLRPNSQRVQTSQSIILPAPFRGLNQRDKQDMSPSGYAEELENFLPSQGEVYLRKGYQHHALGMAENQPVETLMTYTDGSNAHLFAAIGQKLYDVTRAGNVGEPVLNNLTHARWSYTQFANTSGRYLLCVNGVDGLKSYNGQEWKSLSLENINPQNLVYITQHKGRLWMIEKNTLNAWYLPIFAISGAANKLNLGALCKKGGKLIAVSNWTLDAGDGADDYLVFVTSQGECVVYAGINPDHIQSWSMVGIYQTDRPLGDRCLVKFGADLLILTQSGVISMTALLRSQNRLSSISELIRNRFIQHSQHANNTNLEWQILFYPEKSWLIVNTPIQNKKNTQYIYHSILPPPDGWTSFTGQNAYCWAVHDHSLFFGGMGKVYQADIGNQDQDQPISGNIVWASSKMGMPNKKKFNLARLYIRSDQKPNLLLSIQVDYQRKQIQTSPDFSLNTNKIADWDQALWDQEFWGGKPIAFSEWTTIPAIGHSASLHLNVHSTATEFSVISTEILFETGGIL